MRADSLITKIPLSVSFLTGCPGLLTWISLAPFNSVESCSLTANMMTTRAAVSLV
jgi:hypothetical protein